jgi:hypothetical protein
MACDAPACVFEVKRAVGSYELYASPGVGALTTHAPRPIPATPVDYDGILAAVSGLPLVGDAHGTIDAFGVHLTRHFANYYNRISFEFLHRLSREYGEEGLAAASETLIEAGRVCAFNTFGGIMQSTEWNALIRPGLASREDWVHGMVAVVNAFGWGPLAGGQRVGVGRRVRAARRLRERGLPRHVRRLGAARVVPGAGAAWRA